MHGQLVVDSMVMACDNKNEKLQQAQIECDMKKACDMFLWPYAGPLGVGDNTFHTTGEGGRMS